MLCATLGACSGLSSRSGTFRPCTCDAALAAARRQTMKGTQKPKHAGKKPAQKSLKERRAEKRAAAKTTRSLDV